MSQLLDGRITPERCEALFRLFRVEQQLRPWEEYWPLLQKMLERLAAEGVLEIADNSAHLCFAKFDAGIYLPNLLFSSVQTLLWLYRGLLAWTAQDSSASHEILQKEFLTQLQQNAEAGKYLNLLHSTEASAHSNLVSHIEAAREQGTLSYLNGDTKVGAFRVSSFPHEDIQLLAELDGKIRAWEATLPIAEMTGLQRPVSS